MNKQSFMRFEKQVHAKYPRIAFQPEAYQHKRAWAAVAVVLAMHDAFCKYINKSGWEGKWARLRKWAELCAKKLSKRKLSAPAMRDLDTVITDINIALGDIAQHDEHVRWQKFMCLIKIAATLTRDAAYSAPLFTRSDTGAHEKHWRYLLAIMQGIDDDVDKVDGEEVYYDTYWPIYERVHHKHLVAA
ncbi:MAG: hypothetical protein PHN64_04025 [Desulfovibrionaceae bacterium]|nr:hypothetical protein [Desulfovibrionaceae bacterium]